MKVIHFLIAATAGAVVAYPAAAQDAAQPTPESAPAEAAPAAPSEATVADLVAGATVRGIDGNTVGTIEFADAEGATVTTGSAKLYLRVNNFRKDEQGLVIGATREQFEAAASRIAGS